MKLPAKLGLGVAGIFLVAQLVRPERENPPVTGDLTAPPEVKALLKRACYDCHSHETVWPWYSNLAPVSWLVADHVKDGRKHLNFSAWASYDAARVLKNSDEIAEEVEGGEMPMAGYVALHAEAKLTDAEKKAIVDWAKQLKGP